MVISNQRGRLKATAEKTRRAEGGQWDGARLAVVTSRFQCVVRAMSFTLLRTASSSVLSTAKDFSCCITTWEGDLLVSADSLPVHVMSGQKQMVQAVVSCHDDIKEGDIYLNNSPYHGNTHAADHTLLLPIFAPNGEPRFWVHVKAHLADVGNSRPTTYAAYARDVYEEGALLFPGVRIQRNREDIKDLIRMCELRIRAPRDWKSDYNAMVAAARIGEHQMLELGEEIGWQFLMEYVEEWFNYSENLMSTAIGRLKEGTATVENHYDPSNGLPEGIKVRAIVRVDTKPGRISIDLTENDDCVAAGINLSESTARGSALIGVFTGLPLSVPANAGSFRCVNIQLRENCVVGIPLFPASCSTATTNLAHRLINAVARAMTKFGSGRAETGYFTPPAQGVISGRNPYTGEPVVNQIFLNIGAGGASQWADGWLLSSAANAGMIFRDSVEVLEQKYPMYVRDARLLPDREGAGQKIGAPGGRVEYGPVVTEMKVEFSADGKIAGAAGVFGGQDGAPTTITLRRNGGPERSLDHSVDAILLAPGDSIVSYSSSGGGFGRPHDREAEIVARDVREGWISRERARDVYGVALADDGSVEMQETTALRSNPKIGGK